MATPPVPRQELQRAVDLMAACNRRRREVARRLGLPDSTLDHRLDVAKREGIEPIAANVAAIKTQDKLAAYEAQRGIMPDYPEFGQPDPPGPRVPPGFLMKGQSALVNAEGKMTQRWDKTKQGGRDPEDAVILPDPKRITKVSTMTDSQGNVVAQWVAEKPEDAARDAAWKAAAAAMASTLPRMKPLPIPQSGAEHLMACYPVGDHHIGMLAWAEEAGENYDLSIGEMLLLSAIDHLIQTVPPCARSAIVFLGDFMHYDSFDSVTPASRNLLDADGRYPKMVRVAIRSMRYTIEAALRRHGAVHVIVEIGNHDPSSSIFMMECLANLYENEPRVTIDTSPRHFHYFHFGKNLVGTHHGQSVKMEKLPLIMATDQPELWGATEHRYLWTGHVHHDQAKDIEGCRVESFRVLAPQDAWASNKGYRSRRDMKAIVLHRDYGEVARHIVNPAMLEKQS